MQIRGVWKYVQLALIAALIVVAVPGTAFAITSSSNNYQLTESEFSSGTGGESCSDQYCARASIGTIGNANTESTAEFGEITYSEPLLEVIVDPGVSDLGILSTSKTSSKTSIIRVRNYLSGGYTLQIVGTPPKYGDHTLKTQTVPTAATPGTEQFGMNLAANTTPNVGAAPLQVPSGQTNFGQAMPAYATPNMFKFVSGDTVATSETDSGRTDYTLSIIVNVANNTPAGRYEGDYAAVAIPAF